MFNNCQTAIIYLVKFLFCLQFYIYIYIYYCFIVKLNVGLALLRPQEKCLHV